MLKKLIITLLFAAVAVPVFAQRPLRQRFQGQARPPVPLGKIRKGLDLTPAQIDQLRAIQEANKGQRQGIAQEMQQKRQALRDLMAQPNPDAGQVGNAMLALKEAQKRAQQLRQQALNSFKQSLTPEQLKKLEGFQGRRRRKI